jgi:nitrite reductase/ring-hydroxylating ferredoxin subunit
VKVARADEIPDGERKIIEVEGVSIGLFHHQGAWYALRNSCLHRGGPVCTGPLNEGVITCPWHGYQYYVSNGELLLDRSAHLEMYPVEVHDGEVYITFPTKVPDAEMVQLNVSGEVAMAQPVAAAMSSGPRELKENEFRVHDLKPGQTWLANVDGDDVAIYNVDGSFYATQNECTHSEGPLNEGDLDGHQIICPWHDSCFDVRDGSVCRGPAKQPLKTYRVVIDGDVGTVE